IKEGATVPLFIGQTLVNALRDLGYNDTTSAICEFVDNSVQWGANEVRVYFNEAGKKGQKRIDVLVIDDGVGMAPNVLRAPMAFPKSEQERLSETPVQLTERLPRSGTIVYVPDCDRLTYRTSKALADHATKEMARVYRRHLAHGLRLFVNNRRIEPFDPTYS